MLDSALRLRLIRQNHGVHQFAAAKGRIEKAHKYLTSGDKKSPRLLQRYTTPTGCSKNAAVNSAVFIVS